MSLESGPGDARNGTREIRENFNGFFWQTKPAGKLIDYHGLSIELAKAP